MLTIFCMIMVSLFTLIKAVLDLKKNVPTFMKGMKQKYSEHKRNRYIKISKESK